MEQGGEKGQNWVGEEGEEDNSGSGKGRDVGRVCHQILSPVPDLKTLHRATRIFTRD